MGISICTDNQTAIETDINADTLETYILAHPFGPAVAAEIFPLWK